MGPRVLAMRQTPTSGEARAWELLRGRRMLGLQFKRQHVIAGFIVDFYCPALRLIIELDEHTPGDWIRTAYDAVRAKHFEEKGYRVLRVRREDLSEAGVLRLLAEFTH